MPRHDGVSSQLCTHTHTHTHRSVMKCEDELDSGLVRGTLLMLIRGAEGDPSHCAEAEGDVSAGGVWRFKKVCTALYLKRIHHLHAECKRKWTGKSEIMCTVLLKVISIGCRFEAGLTKYKTFQRVSIRKPQLYSLKIIYHNVFFNLI